MTSLLRAKEGVEVEKDLWTTKLCKLLRIKTKAQKNLNYILNAIDKMKLELNHTEFEYKALKKEFHRVYSNPPKTEQYELAMIGNSLFKPR